VVAWATYLFDREDVVWRFIHQYPNRRLLEHLAFGIAAVLIGVAAVLCTRAEAGDPAEEREPSAGSLDLNNLFPPGQLFGEWLYAIGLASLVPLWGSVLLVAGESVRVMRLGLVRKGHDARPEQPIQASRWGRALRRQTVKWGIFLTMIIFAVTLVDRFADYGIVASIFLWAGLNLPLSRWRSGGDPQWV
jgi:hypothetical protein